MISCLIVSPSKAILECSSNDELKKLEDFTKYKNKSAEFQYRRHMKNRRWMSYDHPGWQKEGDKLKLNIEHNLIFIENGKICTRPGIIPYLKELFDVKVTNNIVYPNPKPYPWYNIVKMTPYPYQKESVEKLIAEKHGNVELCTGAGKSLILLMIAQKLGLKTVVLTPSISIFEEIFANFERHFGKGTVGALGGGKKKFGKKFMICVSDSVSNLEPGTKEFEEIANADVLLADESHTIPSTTLEKMCHGILKDIPYRFFFSGTQTRNDGTEKMLKAIIGNTVCSLSTKQGIDGGYVANHEYKVIPVKSSDSSYYSSDALAMKRRHFLNNANIAKFTAQLANAVSQVKKEQTLVLVDELPQMLLLIPLLKVPYSVATSTTDKISLISYITGIEKTKLKKLVDLKPDAYPQAFLDSMTPEQVSMYLTLKNSDPQEAVKKFNTGESKVLIGTSCISTGTNIFPTHHTVNWQGGTSEIKTKQGAVGRSVRLLEKSEFKDLHVPKIKSTIYDFDVEDVEIMRKHLKVRVKFYKSSGTMIQYLGSVINNEGPEDEEDLLDE